MPYNSYLAKGGEMGHLTRSYDWSKTPLGTPEVWSHSLLTAVNIMLNSRFPMLIFWGEDLITFYNDAFRPSLGDNGKHPSSLGQKGEHSWAESWPVIGPMIKNIRANGEAVWFEDQQLPLYRNGIMGYAYWTYSLSPIVDDDKKINGVLVTCIETTKAVESNILLARSENHFRSLVEQIPVAINIFITRNLVIEIPNERMLEIWGRQLYQVEGKPLLVAMPELRNQPFLKRLDDVFNTGKAYYSSDERAVILRNGELTECFFNIVYQPLVNDDGSITRIFQIASEVTNEVYSKRYIQELNEELAATNEELAAGNEELRSMNEEMTQIQDDLIITNARLLESEERFRTMAEGTDVLITVGDESSNATYFNKAWATLTGKSVEDLLEFGWVHLIHPEDRERYKNIYLAAFKNRVPFTSEFRLLSKKGEYCWMFAQGPPRFRPDGSFAGYISSCIDITEQKRDEQRKNDFIGMVSHEMKTPLTSLSAYMQIIEKTFTDANDSFTSGLMQKAGKQVNRMTTMINGFLNVSRLESGKIEINKSLFDMADLLTEFKDEISSLYSTHHFVFQPVEPTQVSADRDKIGHVISNLLSNAVKYSPPGTTIQVACITINGLARVSVKDKGFGIAPEDQTQLFERYYRVKNTATQSVSGFGIGLYLSAEIIQRHDGEIWVESNTGDGSTFYFTILVLK